MNIVHIAPCSPYNEGWGYQDNLLPKYHAKAGNNVTLIITNQEHKDGKLVEVECIDYYSTDRFRVIRKKKKIFINHKITDFLSLIDVYDLLKQLNPDMIFCHGLSNITILQVVRYKKKINSSVIIVQDNHADYNNIGQKQSGFVGFTSRAFWRIINHYAIEYVEKVYGVTPCRQKFAIDYYGIPSEKTDLLIMGADDDKIDLRNKSNIRKRIRKEFNIADDEFVIVTGGKIDNKKNILQLMKAVQNLDKVKLIIFGNLKDDVKNEFKNILLNSKNIIYLGWIDSSYVYNYFFASDLVCFPGQHSVLWEQACASKVPCMFKRWDGMEHVDNGGNSIFLSDVSEIAIRRAILDLIGSEKYLSMKEVAESDKTQIYLYSNISKKSLECFK